MPADPEHLRQFEEAVAESPDNATLRLMAAQAHLDAASDDPTSPHAAQALAHAQHVLSTRPDALDALNLAALAARHTGDIALADRYTRLGRALAGDAGPSAPSTPSVPPVEAAPPAPPDQSGIRWSPDGSHDDLDDDEPIPLSLGPDGEVLAFDQSDFAEMETPTLHLDDVGGLEEVKRRLRTSFLGPMQNPELREMYRTSLQGGMLLYGPPGCGKTFLARAIAGELAARFATVGLHDVLDMWLGKSEQNLHAVFERARRHSPCVLFLDEIDAMGMKRSNLSHSAGRNVVVQLLSEMDGMGSNNEGLFVIGATNQPWDVDPALRRPGRFDRVLLVLPPDPAARVAILRYHLRDRPVDDGIDVARLAARTDLYSGADLRLVCDSAAEMALEDSMTTGQARPITQSDLERALEGVHASTRAWFEVAKNFAQFANEAGRYDDLLDYMRAHRML